MMANPIAFRRMIGARHKWIRMYLAGWCDRWAFDLPRRFHRAKWWLLRAADALRASAKKHW